MSNFTYDLFSWKCFLALVEKGTLRKASKALSLDPSSISRRIANLEEELQTKLLEQQGRQLFLTPEGKAALQNFAPIVEAADAAMKNIPRRAAPDPQFLHIVAPIGYTSTIVRRTVSRFMTMYPDHRFWLESGRYGAEDFDQLGRGIDMIISTIAREHSAFAMIEISDHRNCCFASPSFLARHPLEKPRDLLGLPLAGNTQFITNRTFTNAKTGEAVSRPFTYALLSDNTNILMDWTANGNGVLINSPFTAAVPYITEERLFPVMTDWHLPNNHVYAYVSKRDIADPRKPLSVLVDVLKSVSDEVNADAEQVYARAVTEKA